MLATAIQSPWFSSPALSRSRQRRLELVFRPLELSKVGPYQGGCVGFGEWVDANGQPRRREWLLQATLAAGFGLGPTCLRHRRKPCTGRPTQSSPLRYT